MSIHVPLVTIPLVSTVVLLAVMFRPYQQSGDFDFGSVFRLLWLIPISFVWTAYAMAMLWWRS